MTDPYRPVFLAGQRFGKSGPVVRGLGVVAPKGPIAAMVAALRAVVQSGLPRYGSLLFAGVTRDLAGNHDGPRELCEAFSLQPDWAVVAEASENRLVLGARGIVQSRVRLTGKPTHRGNPSGGANPLYALADVLQAIERQPLPCNETLGPATVSPFDVGSDSAAPRTPEHVDLFVDRRTLPHEKTSDVVQSLSVLVDQIVRNRPGITAEVEFVRGMHSFGLSAEHGLVQAIRSSVEAPLGVALGTMRASFASNAGYLAIEKACPAVGFGPGAVSDLGLDEHVEVAQFEHAARVYAVMMGVVDASGMAV